MEIFESSMPNSLPEALLVSETFEKLMDLIHRRKTISPFNEFWDEIEALVLKYFPSFKKNLIVLTNGKLTQCEYQTAMLVKLGIPNIRIATFCGRSPGAINTRKTGLGKKIFGELKPVGVINDKIQTL